MNKKGMTLVEIIIAIVLISIVLIFLFSLLITVKDINDESEVNSTYLINKSLILKNIEEDLSKADSVELQMCDPEAPGRETVTAIYSGYNSSLDYFNGIGEEYKAYNCIKFVYNEDTNDVGFLGIYYYKNKESYVISYIHGNVKATRVLPDYEKVPKNISTDDSMRIINTWTHNGSKIDSSYFSSGIQLNDGEFHVINIPIIGPDGKDYGINISYYKKLTPP